MFKSKKGLICIFVLLTVLYLLPISSNAAKLGDAFKKPLEDVAGVGGAGYKSGVEPEAVIGKVIQAALSFVGILFLVLMIYGGYLWMMARGSEQEVEKAKNLFSAAIVGLIIVLAAYAISYFILDAIGSKTLITPGSSPLDPHMPT